MKQYKIKELHELTYQRICTMQGGLYMIIDYYPHVENQPMICIIQLDSSKIKLQNQRINLPEYLEVEQEITDMKEYMDLALAKKIIPALAGVVPMKENPSVQSSKQQSSGDEK